MEFHNLLYKIQNFHEEIYYEHARIFKIVKSHIHSLRLPDK